MSADEYAMLEGLCKLRAGCREPYTPSDYLVTLFRKVLPLDEKQYHLQANALGMCDHCNEVLPSGCGGAFKGQTTCYHTSQYKELELENKPKQTKSALDQVILKQHEFEMIESISLRLLKFYNHSRNASQ